MRVENFRVIIVGGGLGGLCLAQGLKRAGIPFSVFERDRDVATRVQGYRLSIAPDGFEALRANLPDPLWTRIEDATAPLNGMSLITEQLDELMFLETPAPENAVRRYGSLSRVALRDVLLSGLGADVHFGKRFVRYELLADRSVRCFFEDGGSVEGSLLVGCDGANSGVQSQLLPAAERVDTGVRAIIGKVPLGTGAQDVLPPALGDSAVVIDRKPGGAFVARHRLEGDEGSYVYCSFGGPRSRFPAELESLPPERLLALVEQLTDEWHPLLRALVQRIDPATLRALRFRVSPRVKAWPSGPVTLLGDAIHSMPPSGGLGANTALRDASVLAAALVEHVEGRASLADAVGRYEAKMRRYAYAAVDESMGNLRRMARENPLVRGVGRVGAKLAGRMLGMTRRERPAS